MVTDWPKKIHVDQRIVNLLSESTYTNIYQTIREFVNNSYDADATRVNISVNIETTKEDACFVEIRDDGVGMTPEEFGSNFLTLAYTPKTSMKKTKLGRNVVGKFGVGYLSATPFCDILYVKSKIRGNPTVFEAKIDCRMMRRTKEEVSFLSELNVHGRTFANQDAINEQYTIVRLVGLTPQALDFFTKAVYTNKRSSITSLDPVEKLGWYLQQILPLDYHEDFIEYKKIFSYSNRISMKVYLNDKPLFRNVVEGKIWDSGLNDIIDLGKGIKLKYVISTPWRTVQPTEARGLQIRMNDVGVGEPSYFGVNWETGHMYSRLRWITGEIHIIEGLEKELRIDRNGFAQSEAYNHFYTFFKEKIIDACKAIEKESMREKEEMGDEELETKVHDLLDEIALNKEKEEKQEDVNDLFLFVSPKTPISTIEAKIDAIVYTAEERGYSVKRKNHSNDEETPILSFDKKQKSLIVIDEHPDKREKIVTNNGVFTVEYRDWEPKKENKFCEYYADTSVVVFNTRFPLFHDWKLKTEMKQIYTILAIEKRKHGEKALFIEGIEESLAKTFMLEKEREK